MRTFIRFEMFIVTAVAFAGLARADIVFNMTMTGVNGVASPSVYVGAYYGTADGAAIDLYCDDYFHDSYIGQKWQAYQSTLNDLSLTRFGGVADAPTKYREVMWIVEQFDNQPTSSWVNIHAAVWDIFSPSAFAPTPEISHWLTLAALPSNEGSVDPNAFYIYTPSNPSIADSQEFISPIPQKPLSTVPFANPVPENEPTWVLLGIAIATGSAVSIRVKKQEA